MIAHTLSLAIATQIIIKKNETISTQNAINIRHLIWSYSAGNRIFLFKYFLAKIPFKHFCYLRNLHLRNWVKYKKNPP